MGINAYMRVNPNPLPTQDRLDELNVELADRFGKEVWAELKKDFDEEVFDEEVFDEEVFKVEIDLGLMRYYGPGYERGPMPTIFVIGLFVVNHFEIDSLEYGGDGSYEDYNVTAWFDLIKHFFAVGHKPYRDGFKTIL